MPEWVGDVTRAYDERLDAGAVDPGASPVTVDVPATGWLEALEVARDTLRCTFFDWLSAVDEGTDGFRVVCHLARHRRGTVDHLLLRTLLPREEPALPSAVALFAGALWHERETHEMFGIAFLDRAGAPLSREPLLLPREFEGHPLRKDFVLASRVARPWPGAQDPADRGDAGTSARRRLRPPGVPRPDQWGPPDD